MLTRDNVYFSYFPLVLEGVDLEAEIATLDSYDNEPSFDTQANKKHKFRYLVMDKRFYVIFNVLGGLAVGACSRSLDLFRKKLLLSECISCF